MLLSVSGVSKSFGADLILSGVSFRIQAREKVALVGRNGTGKTTLLKIITGSLAPDTGSASLARGAKVGYLSQEMPIGSGRTVIQEAEQAVSQQLALRARLDELEATLENATPEDIEEYSLLQEHFLEAEGYSAERDLRVVLNQMGFPEEAFDKPTDRLSGGEKTRLALARLLLEEPDLLILDEPTNHLDLQATEWLEGWIRGYHGAVLLVSHDRTFLEDTADRVLEMRDHGVKAYPGPFEKYLKLRADEDARLAEVARRQDIEIAKMDEYVRRFMNSQRTAQARGRLKLMNRALAEKVSAPKNEKGMKGGFEVKKRSGDQVVITDNLTLGYSGEPLIRNLDWTVRLGERWGIIGENGAGKSTLVKAFLGQLQPMEGKAGLGSNVVAGYFSQDVSDLDPELSPLDLLVWECDMLPADARNLLGRFLITGDDVFRPLKTLSGGEKNKLSLARLTQLSPNLLVLDEPTNHLDMASREALAEILQEYKGTLVLVSHDRWLLDHVTNHTLDIRRTGVTAYPGPYAEYKRRLAKKVNIPAAASAAKVAPTMTPRELSKEIERIARLVFELENVIAEKERLLAVAERDLWDMQPGANVNELTKRHHECRTSLDASMSAWESESLKLENLKALRG